jgi:hypothetical protein
MQGRRLSADHFPSEPRPGDQPLDTLGALTHSTSLRVILSLSNG